MLLDLVAAVRKGFRIASKLDFVQLRGIAHRVHEAFEQCAGDFYHVGLLLGHGKMEMIPQLPPYQGNRVRKGGASLAIPRCAAHAGRSLLDQQLGSQRDDGVEAQQRRGGASNRAVIPLALRFHPQTDLPPCSEQVFSRNPLILLMIL